MALPTPKQLLQLAKACTKCKSLKSLDNFHIRNISKGYLESWCRECISDKMSAYWKVDTDKKRRANRDSKKKNRASARETEKTRYRKNPGAKLATNAKRRAANLNATPAWADLATIRAFYEARPKGFDVDHIVPLRGKDVCGLHVPWNLQYLPMSENRSKGNKYGP